MKYVGSLRNLTPLSWIHSIVSGRFSTRDSTYQAGVRPSEKPTTSLTKLSPGS